MTRSRVRSRHTLLHATSITAFALLVASTPIWATGVDEGTSATEAAAAPTAELTFTFWGSAFEREAVEQMIEAFNDSHPNIRVRGQHIPDAYNEKISTMVAGGTPPDVGYLNEQQALLWAGDGVIADLTPYFKADLEASSRLEAAYYNYNDGASTIGTNTAAEIMILYYNKSLFDAAGLDYPPAHASEAWTWTNSSRWPSNSPWTAVETTPPATHSIRTTSKRSAFRSRPGGADTCR